MPSKPDLLAALPRDVASFAQAEVAAGRYASIEDVVRAGKLAIEHERVRYEQEFRVLFVALQEGDRSELADGYSLEGTLSKLGLGPLST